jgi:GTP pyrophosphokinase
VHVKGCPRVFALDPNRRIEVAWDERADERRKIRIRELSLDQPGILAQVTKSISQAGINIGGARVTTQPDQKANHTFDLWVADAKSLGAVMKEIQRIRGVLSVERVRA